MTTATNTFSKKTAALIVAFLAIFAMLTVGVTPAHAANYTIGGTVTNSSGTAVAGVTVTATAPAQSDVTVTTDSNGVYSVSVLDATAWTLKFTKTGYATEYFNDKLTAATANTITLAGAAVTGKDVVLATEGVISGVTYNAASAILTSVTVQLYLDGVAYGSSITSDGTTGAYSFSTLPAGSYILGFSKTGYVTQFSGGASTLATATAFTVNAGSANTKNVNLAAQGKITGTTTPFATTVDVYSTAGFLLTNLNSSGTDGTYEIANLDPGTYRLQFRKTGYITEWWNDSANFVGATGVTVNVGATTASISPTLVANPGSGTIDTTAAVATVTGNAVEGQTLTANNSGWPTAGTVYNFQWQYNDGTTWQPIVGAISNTYLLDGTYYNKTIRVAVTGSRIGYVPSAEIYSAATAAVAHAFTTKPTPTITGTAAVGQTLTAVPGTWAPVPDSFTYQWYYGGAIIPSATASTLDVTNFVAGWPITVTVTAVKTNYPNTAMTSAATASVGQLMTVTPVPTISGTAAVGKTLTVVNGAWTPSNVSFTYQWYRNGIAISGATAATYSPVAADVGSSLTVTEVAALAGYTSTTKSSAGTSAVLNQITKVTPTISGSTTVGSVLTATPGTWAPNTTTLTYQWYRNGTAITGATAATYTVAADDDTKSLTVTVTGTASGYDPASATSAVFLVGKQFTLHPTPTIKGNFYLGQTLTATIGKWDTGATLTHQWYRDGVAIAGARWHTYKLTSADVKKVITFTSTATAAGFVPKTETSAATIAILSGKPFTKAPTPRITGNARVGANLTAIPGTWSPVPTKYYYQWFRGTTAITGATKSTYKLVEADKGFNISVSVKVARSGYATTAKKSGLTISVK